MSMVWAGICLIIFGGFLFENLGRIAGYITNHQLWWVLILGVVLLFVRALKKRK